MWGRSRHWRRDLSEIWYSSSAHVYLDVLILHLKCKCKSWTESLCVVLTSLHAGMQDLHLHFKCKLKTSRVQQHNHQIWTTNPIQLFTVSWTLNPTLSEPPTPWSGFIPTLQKTHDIHYDKGFHWCMLLRCKV